MTTGVHRSNRWSVASWLTGNVYVSVKWLEVVERSQTNTLSLPLMSFESLMIVKENPDRKKHN